MAVEFVAGAVLLAALVALGCVAAGWLMRARVADAELALERDGRERAEVLAEHRRKRLVDAAARAVQRRAGDARLAEHARALEEDLAAAGDDVDAAAELVLQRLAARDRAAAGGAPRPAAPAEPAEDV